MNNQAFIEEKYEDVTQKTAKKFDIFPHKGNTSIAIVSVVHCSFIKKKKNNPECVICQKILNNFAFSFSIQKHNSR